jgi:Ca2+-binding EF-hand superfamily protein
MRIDRLISCGILLFAFSRVVSVSVAEEIRLPLETTVKVLGAPEQAAPANTRMRVNARPVPAPTTPAAKYPQYRLIPQQKDLAKAGTVANPGIRFFLNLPTETLLVEATITIDDVPFAMLRQKRVAQILADVNVTQDAATEPANAAEQKPPAPIPVPVLPVVPVPAIPAVQLPTSTSIADRLKHTIAVTGETPTAEEIDWLLSRWIDGPTILPLNSNFQRFRANQRPEFLILDRDHDGTISAEELQLAEKTFLECDLNQDGIIQFTEIAAAATDPRVKTAELESSELIVFVPDDASAADAFRRLTPAKSAGTDATPVSAHRFDTNANGQFDPEELVALRQRAPDLSLTIAFNSVTPDKSRIALTAVADGLKQSLDKFTADPTGILLTLNGTPVILQAVQMQPSDQISIGAVNDGYPILPALDPNDDGRLTVRELRGVLEILKTFDRNDDGALTTDEVRSPIRLCFGLGASVHRELLGIRSLHRPKMNPTTSGPEWFVRMDRNKDNDLARSEFPGTDEQFQALDADHDELVSADEALKFDKQEVDVKQNNADRPAEDLKPSTAIDSTSKEETKP